MTTGARIGVLAAVIVLAVAGFVLASGSDDETSGSDTAAETATTAPTGTSGVGTTETQTTPEPKPKPRPRFTRVVVAGGQPRGGVKRIRVNAGERVRLIFQSDVADHVHIHGYDLQKDVGPGKNARFNFKATIEGSFEIELEERAIEIASLSVRP